MKLYRLIWSRFVAVEMTPAIIDTVAETQKENDVTARANGSQMKFEGFTKLYVLSREVGEKDNVLPPLAVGDAVKMLKTDPAQHATQPPAR